MTPKGRPERVAERVREEIAALLTKEIKDPRIGFVSIMSVRMSPDLRYANVYVSVLGEEKQRASSMAGLRNAARWMRGVVGRKLALRFAPEIRFFPDDTLDRVFHLEEIFDQLHAEKEKPADGTD
jgi:ribosome-binding factor A